MFKKLARWILKDEIAATEKKYGDLLFAKQQELDTATRRWFLWKARYQQYSYMIHGAGFTPFAPDNE